MIIKYSPFDSILYFLIDSEKGSNVALFLCEYVDESLYYDKWIQEIWEDA